MNRDIEDGKIINWQQFKKLKRHKSCMLDFDSMDMTNFENFFKTLYADEHATIDSITKDNLSKEAHTLNDTAIYKCETDNNLNCQITTDELTYSIRQLKVGKAASEDMISNEILKWLNTENLNTLKDLFNICLDSGTYPWNTNIITPIHKKGSKEDPDNYRAVAVSSSIGKLFSTILLERFKEFRRKTSPDPPNQLGFTKNAQTYDHILTLQTIASKYKKLKKPVYAIFVDFSKAFDSVCRQALYLKLAENNATGKFYNVIRDMYKNSNGKIKLSGHISNTFDIKKGTEQGHPLSPDLFKLYLKNLSPDLDFDNCPMLDHTFISHLLWADDLILLSLDKQTAQNQLDSLNDFCMKWGLEPNIGKTKAMVMGCNPNKEHQKLDLRLGKLSIETVSDYCYLGLIITDSGGLKNAQATLKNKAMRAFFGLKRTVDRTKISFQAANTLFDSLIKPITLYGAPIWLPTSPIVKNILSAMNNYPENIGNITTKILRTPCERVHLSFLRWSLGVHKKSSTIGLWGESGRFPLIYQSIKLTLSYFKRILNSNKNSLVHAALTEQIRLNLPWYRNVEGLAKLDEIYDKNEIGAYKIINKDRPEKMKFLDNVKKRVYSHDSLLLREQLSHLRTATPISSRQFRIPIITENLRNHFIRCWKFEKSNSKKLALFYDKIKQTFGKELYLDHVANPASRYATTKIRISAHDLEIETGRYKNIPRDKRTCKWCKLTLGTDVIEADQQLNFVENENHVLFTCDLYSDLRQKLIRVLKSTPISNYPNTNTVQSTLENVNQSNIQSSFFALQSNSEKFSGDQSTFPNRTHKPQSQCQLLSFSFSSANQDIPKPHPKCKSTHNSPNRTHPSSLTNNDQTRQMHSYIQNTLSTFMKKCLVKRKIFLAELKLKETPAQ